MNRRKVNAETLELIKRWEGLRLEAYLCPAGKWTIGYGHTKTAMPGMRITPERAEELLRQDLEVFEEGISRLITVPLTDNQFGALVSWAFNVGLGNVEKSTLRRRLNEGRYDEVPEQLLRWNKVRNPQTGRLEVNQGVANRRAAEVGLWVRGTHVAGRDVPQEPPTQSSILDVAHTNTGVGSALTTGIGMLGPVFAAIQGVPWPIVATLGVLLLVGYFGTLFWRSRRQ